MESVKKVNHIYWKRLVLVHLRRYYKNMVYNSTIMSFNIFLFCSKGYSEILKRQMKTYLKPVTLKSIYIILCSSWENWGISIKASKLIEWVIMNSCVCLVTNFGELFTITVSLNYYLELTSLSIACISQQNLFCVLKS